MIAAVAVGLGTLVALLSGRRLGIGVVLRGLALVMVGAVLTGASRQRHFGSAGLVLFTCGALLVVSFALLNLQRVRSLALVALGSGLNIAASLRYGGMPVSRTALLRAGITVSGASGVGTHVVQTTKGAARFIGDVIPVPVALIRTVISLGDGLILLGIAIASMQVLTRPPSKPPRSP